MYIAENDIIALRVPEIGDLDKFYTWQNDPIGQVCISAKYSRFELWQYLQNPIIENESRYIIVEKKSGEAIGYVENIDGVGIYIDRCHRNKGFGSAALQLFSNHLNKNLFAKITANNLPSQRIFAKAGFYLSETEEGIGLWINRGNKSS